MMPGWPVIAAIGLASGIFAGFFGLGGGLLIVPGLMVLAGFTVTKAAGTSLAALLLPVGALGAVEYWRAGQVDLRAAAIIAAGLLVGAFIGAKTSLSLPTPIVHRAFGFFLIVVGVRFAFFK